MTRWTGTPARIPASSARHESAANRSGGTTNVHAIEAMGRSRRACSPPATMVDELHAAPDAAVVHERGGGVLGGSRQQRVQRVEVHRLPAVDVAGDRGAPVEVDVVEAVDEAGDVVDVRDRRADGCDPCRSPRSAGRRPRCRGGHGHRRSPCRDGGPGLPAARCAAPWRSRPPPGRAGCAAGPRRRACSHRPSSPRSSRVSRRRTRSRPRAAAPCRGASRARGG